MLGLVLALEFWLDIVLELGLGLWLANTKGLASGPQVDYQSHIVHY